MLSSQKLRWCKQMWMCNEIPDDAISLLKSCSGLFSDFLQRLSGSGFISSHTESNMPNGALKGLCCLCWFSLITDYLPRQRLVRLFPRGDQCSESVEVNQYCSFQPILVLSILIMLDFETNNSTNFQPDHSYIFWL